MRHLPRIPGPARRTWLTAVFPSLVATIAADPAGAIQGYGFESLIVGMTVIGLAQVWAIASEVEAKGWSA